MALAPTASDCISRWYAMARCGRPARTAARISALYVYAFGANAASPSPSPSVATVADAVAASRTCCRCRRSCARRASQLKSSPFAAKPASRMLYDTTPGVPPAAQKALNTSSAASIDGSGRGSSGPPPSGVDTER